MTVDDVRKRIAAIEDCNGDDESMHLLEDKLHQEVLAAIAFGGMTMTEARDLAEEALTTRQISFSRWCA